MIITSSNVQGLNSRGKQRYFKDRLKRDKPGITIIQETKIAELNLKEIIKSYKPNYEVIAQDVRVVLEA